MFKQLQELQRQKKLEEYKQSSGTQYPLLNNGIPVRDASQMFMFGNTNLVQGLSNRLVQNQFAMSNESASLLTKHNSEVNDHDRYAEKMENVSRNQDLDPLEQKILFNVEDNSWGASVGKHGSMGTESFENTHHSSDFPSLQSGSWSALMQSAVAEVSSGDAGLQEEWSGSSLNENQPCNIVESGKHPTPELIPGFQHIPATHFQRNFKDRSAAPNSTGQASHNMLELLHKVDKEYSHGTQSGYTNSAPITEAPKAEPDDAFTPSHDNSSRSQSFGLKLAPPSQRQLVNYFEPSRTSLQVGRSSKPFQDPQSNNNQLQNQNYMTNQSPLPTLSYTGSRHPGFSSDASQKTSHLVSVKNEDGQESSTLEAKQHPMAAEMAQQNMWVDVPVQQNPSGLGSCEPPSTSYAANSRTETASEASKRLDYWKYVKSENNFLETDAHMNNSQGLDDGRGFASKTYIGKETLSGNLETNANREQHHGNHALPISPGNLEAFGRSLKQSDASPHNHSHVNPMNYDPGRRAVIKIERVTCDYKIPQATSLAQPNSAYGNYMNHPGSSAATGDQLVKSSSQPPLPSFYSQHLDVANQNMVVLKSKKRKCPTFERLPWHKEVTEDCVGLHDMSTAEMEWAKSANRLPEKLKEEAGEVARSRGVVHPKKRLILTTQLMQLLFRPAPAMALSEDATAHCDDVTYYAAKLALGDACSLAGHSRMPHDISGSSSRTSMIPKSFDHQNLSKTVEGFIDRSKRLEDELLRLEKGESSILEVRVEFQDLDKFSVINRFAKFHGRGPLVTADTASSGGGSTVPKLYPQRYVTASPMPRMVPEGLRCLSL